MVWIPGEYLSGYHQLSVRLNRQSVCEVIAATEVGADEARCTKTLVECAVGIHARECIAVAPIKTSEPLHDDLAVALNHYIPCLIRFVGSEEIEGGGSERGIRAAVR